MNTGLGLATLAENAELKARIAALERENEDLRVKDERRFIRTEDILRGARYKLAEMEAKCSVDGPIYNSGRLEGWADVAAQLRKILDPKDTHHWNLDGLLAEVARLRGGVS
jgi:hypothetical protein